MPEPSLPTPGVLRSDDSCAVARDARGPRLRPAGPARSARWWVALLAALPGVALAADSTSVRVEVGTATEVSNEQYYESSIDDTTFLGRRLLDAPETRLAAVALLDLHRTFGDGRWLVRFAPDVSVGDQAVRTAASATIRGQAGDRLRVSLEPRAEYRRDDAFGLARRDWRASLVARARRLDLDESGALRVTAGSEIVRSLEGADGFVLSGHSARAAVGYSRTPLFGSDWDLEYGLVARAYRDSTDRDHLEHRLLAALRGGAGGPFDYQLVAEGERRQATRNVTGSRDRYLRLDGEAGAGIALGEAWALRPAARIEWVRHDEPDSVVDFDYAVARAQLALAREIGAGWRVSGGVRAEWLAAPWSSAEEYGEVAAMAELDRFTGGSMWSLAPAAGRRAYARSATAATSGGLLAPLLHSDFRFVDVTALLDQPLPARLRLRVTGAARAEWHDLDAHDARSLYFSCDVRRLF